jgi:hypothetical protein
MAFEKTKPKIWSAFVILIKLPKVNHHPICEISPNLVTLVAVVSQSLMVPS